MPMRAGRVLTRRATLWALAGVWLLTERVCFVGVLCFSRRGTVAVFHVLSNTHIQLKLTQAPMCFLLVAPPPAAAEAPSALPMARPRLVLALRGFSPLSTICHQTPNVNRLQPEHHAASRGQLNHTARMHVLIFLLSTCQATRSIYGPHQITLSG